MTKSCFRCQSGPRYKTYAYCIDCKRAYDREYQARDREKFNQRTRERRNRIADVVYKMKESGACIDCGRSDHHFLMEYDHLSDKYMGIARMISANKSLVDILKEIEKCELVCVRCHKIRTYVRSHPECNPHQPATHSEQARRLLPGNRSVDGGGDLPLGNPPDS